MTYKDLIDTLVVDSGDAGASYRTNAFRWLNLVRQEAAARGTWKSAKDSTAATLSTDPLNLVGVYTLNGYGQVVGDEMYNVTDDSVIRHDTEMTLKSFDANENEYGPPTLWADAGMSTLGEIQVRFWPIPAEVFVIDFLGTRILVDVTSAAELVSIDPYFGALSDVGVMLQAGLRYHHDKNNNEDSIQTRTARSEFLDLIKLISSNGGADSTRTSRLEPVTRRPYGRPLGRLDPSHFNNR